ncbi:hypothetical protein D3C73_1407640 [compost metagenome]
MGAAGFSREFGAQRQQGVDPLLDPEFALPLLDAVGVTFQSGDLGLKAQAVEKEVVLVPSLLSQLLPELDALLLPGSDLFILRQRLIHRCDLGRRPELGVVVASPLESSR